MSEPRAAARSRPAFHLGSGGLVASWHGSLGPMVARLESFSRERPAFVRGLGHPGADLPVTPELLVTSSEIVALFCEEDGAWSSRLSLDGADLHAPRHVLPGATHIALAASGAGGRLFGADAGGIVSVPLDERGAPSGEISTHVSERRSAARVAATKLRDEELLIAVHPGENEWSVVSTRGARHATVRHQHHAPIEDVCVRSAGGRAAVLFTTRAGVEIAFVGAGGKVIERPLPVRGASLLADPDAVFCDDHWVLLARDAEAGAIRVLPLAPKGVQFSLPQCDGPFSTAYRSQTYTALEVEPFEERAELRMWRCDKRGGSRQRRVMLVENPDASTTRCRRAVRRGLAALADGMSRSRGYRDAPARPALGRDGTTLELLDDEGRISLRVVPSEISAALTLRVASALGDDAELPEAPPSLIRLALWVRERLTPGGRARGEARLAWASALAGELGGRVLEAQHAGSTVVLQLELDELPPPEAILRWLSRLRAGQSSAP